MVQKKKQQGSHLDKLVNSAVQEGIDTIIKENPKFASFQTYLAKHINNYQLEEKIENLKLEVAKEPGLDNYQKTKKLSKQISSYVASGEMLDDIGKETILKKSLEDKTKKGFFHKIFHRTKFDGEKYFDKTMEAFEDFYALFKSGDYAKRMPELSKSVETLHDMKFLNPAVDVLKIHGLIDDKKYKFLKTNIYNKIGQESAKLSTDVEKYIIPEAYKVAASIMIVFGITFLALTGVNMTGNLIGNMPAKVSGLWGGGFILLGLLLFLITKKKHKNKRF